MSGEDRRLAFFVPGTAVQQGSKNIGKHGQMYDARGKDLKDWRNVIGMFARRAMPADWVKFDGAIRVEYTFFRQRPTKHFRTGRYSHLLRDDAPIYCTTTPDGDKLERAANDALTQAGVWVDDANVARWIGTKRYADPGQPTGVLVSVREMPNVRPQAATPTTTQEGTP